MSNVPTPSSKEHYIILPGLSAVKEALIIYASLKEQFKPAPPNDPEPSFLFKLFESIEGPLEYEQCSQWYGNFNLLGTVFEKTEIHIEVQDRENEVYALGIWHAYKGDEPHKILVRALGNSCLNS